MFVKTITPSGPAAVVCVSDVFVHVSINLIWISAGPILSLFFALIVHSELKSVHPGFPVAFIF